MVHHVAGQAAVQTKERTAQQQEAKGRELLTWNHQLEVSVEQQSLALLQAKGKAVHSEVPEHFKMQKQLVLENKPAHSLLNTVDANNPQFFHFLLLLGEVLKSGPFSLVTSFSYFALSIKVSRNHDEGGFPQDKMFCSQNIPKSPT